MACTNRTNLMALALTLGTAGIGMPAARGDNAAAIRASEALDLGFSALNQADYPRAIELLTEALQHGAIPPLVHYELGLAYLWSGQPEQAQLAFGQARLGDHVYLPSLVGQVLASHALGHTERALEEMAAVVALRFERLQGDIYYYYGCQPDPRAESALQLWNERIADAPDDALAHYCRGVAKGTLGRVDAARADVKRSLELAPDFWVAALYLAELTTEPPARVRWLDAAIDAAPEIGFLYRMRADVRRDLGQTDLEQEDLSAAVEHGDEIARPRRALLRAEQGRWKEAADDAEELACRAPYNLPLLTPDFDLGDSLMMMGLSDFGPSSGRQDRRVRAFRAFLVGQRQLWGGVELLAVSEFQRAVDHDGRFAPAHVMLALCLQQKGDLGDAMTHYDRAVQLNRDLWFAALAAGDICRVQGDWVAARSRYSTALEGMDRTGVLTAEVRGPLYASLGQVELSLGNLDAAERHLTTGLYFDAGSCRPALAKVRETRGDVKGAIRMIDIGLRGGSADPALYLARARLQRQAGQSALAAADLRAVLSLECSQEQLQEAMTGLSELGALSTCNACQGAGAFQVDCITCDPTGRQICWGCTGTGRQPGNANGCGICFGTLFIPCTACHGTKRASQLCGNCAGWGQIP